MLLFTGAHVRSAPAIRTFWYFTVLSIFVDFLWLFVYSPLRPIAWTTMLSVSRKDQVRAVAIPLNSVGLPRFLCIPCQPAVVVCAQLSLMLTVLNTAYKGMVVWTAIQLHMLFAKRDALIEGMEIDAGVSTPLQEITVTTSSGEAQDARSLAAQASR